MRPMSRAEKQRALKAKTSGRRSFQGDDGTSVLLSTLDLSVYTDSSSTLESSSSFDGGSSDGGGGGCD